MGKATPTSDDDVLRRSEATLTAVGQSTAWTAFTGRFNITLAGPFTGSAVVERSFDGGTTPVVLTSLGGAVVFSAPATEVLEAPEAGVLYRVRCTALTAGSIRARISQ